MLATSLVRPGFQAFVVLWFTLPPPVMNLRRIGPGRNVCMRIRHGITVSNAANSLADE